MRIVLSLVLGVLLFTALAGCGKLNFQGSQVSESEEQRQSRRLTEQANALDSRLGVETKNLPLAERVAALENASGLFIKWDGGLIETVDALADMYDVSDGPMVTRVDELGRKMEVPFEGSGALVVRVKALRDAYHSKSEQARVQYQLSRMDKYVARLEKLEDFLSLSPPTKDFEPRLQAVEQELFRDTAPSPAKIRVRLAKSEAAAGM